MRSITSKLVIMVCLAAPTPLAQASDLHIELPGNDTFSRTEATFRCDGNAQAMGLPNHAFHVMYINGAGNSLALLPIGAHRLIFTSVLSGSGARYAADKYTWSDGGSRGAFLSADQMGQHAQTLCKKIQ